MFNKVHISILLMAFFAMFSTGKAYANDKQENYNKCVKDCTRYIPNEGPNSVACIRGCHQWLAPEPSLPPANNYSDGGGASSGGGYKFVSIIQRR